MAVQYLTTLRNNRLDEVTTDSGATAWLQVWDGALPATPATAPAGVLLASMALANPIAPAAAAGVLTLTVSPVPTDASAAASGTPTFCRIATTETGTTTGVVQMSAAVGSGDISFSAAITVGGTVTLTSLTITDGNS